MDILKSLTRLLIITCLCSCAKVSYISKASLGQFKLLYDARENEEILKDPNISNEDKEKIKIIEVYKKFFYEYWEKEPTKTYAKTTLLGRDAVSYLVISSAKDKIKANEECFWFVGCFPYLGFFDYNDALEYEKKMTEEGNETYLRKVLAYSTLNNFSDPILSTFFYYNEFELAETIFHELFHTIFFIKNEVELNENLANLIGKKMVEIYFKDSPKSETAKKYLKEEEKYKTLMELIIQLGGQYQEILQKDHSLESKNKYIQTVFLPTIVNKCSKLELDESRCWPTRIKWNNATFAAFLTYEKNQNEFSDLLEQNDGDLKLFLQKIKEKYSIL